MDKKQNSYKTIGEVAKILDLKDKKKGNLSTHTIRFWEKEFKQIKPLILSGKRRYYNTKSIELLKKIKFLLKEQGMTINGVKKLLKSKESLELDELANNSIKASNIKSKILKLSNLIKNIKDIK
jgi:DNA-binding transcriptional MerR regulator